MKNLKLYNNIKKLTSFVLTLSTVAISGCSYNKENSNKSSNEVTTTSKVENIDGYIITTPVTTTTKEVEVTTSFTTPKPTETTTNVTTTTTLVTTPVTTATINTPATTLVTTTVPTVITTTTKKPETTYKPKETTKQDDEILLPNPSNRLEEIEFYYWGIKRNDVIKFTKNNINDINSFMSVAINFKSECLTNINGDGPYFYFTMDYNINNNDFSGLMSQALLERIYLVALLNYEYLNENTIKQIFSIYTYDEIKNIPNNISSLLYMDVENDVLYDFSKIIIDKQTQQIMTDAKNAYLKKDKKKLEKIIDENINKVNDTAQAILVTLKYKLCQKIDYSQCIPAEMFSTIADKLDIYNISHPKTLVKN